MSLLTPERVPVKVYKWDDVGAPALDKTAGCVATIFKTCLVTGYGTKESAGWTMPWEDTAAGIKVLRPEVGPHTDFYLRLSADTGTEMAAQVYLNMTDANTGDLKLQCATPFKYGKGNVSGKWLLIASGRGVWFLCEQNESDDVTKTGSYFFCGDAAADSTNDRIPLLMHTGGTNNNGRFATIFGHNYAGDIAKLPGEYVTGQAMVGDVSYSTDLELGYWTGVKSRTVAIHIMQLMFIIERQMVYLPGAFVSSTGAIMHNFDNVVFFNSAGLSTSAINFGTGARLNNNIYFAADFWDY